MTADLLFEIGCEELPASFVRGAVKAMPDLAREALAGLRLGHGELQVYGTPRRLALLVSELQTEQDDLEEEVTGPPVRAAFKDGQPTRAAEAFATKLGCSVEALERVDTPKGEYLRGVRKEKGRSAHDLLPEALAAFAGKIPFRKSMRWGSGSLAFGRPIRWLVCLLGHEVVPVELGTTRSGKTSFGHRFLKPEAIELDEPSGYADKLRAAHVIADPQERAARMRERLVEAATKAGGILIEDEFLIGENLSLVEDPQVVIGSFAEEFLALPEEVILEVARGHQRYFGLRTADGKLMAKYLAVVNTANKPELIAVGNDRVMRARLADAEFFYREDLKKKLIDRRSELGGIVFQNRLGSVLDKSTRMEQLVVALAGMLGAESDDAKRGAVLSKCDLVTWMVGEFPELQGDVGSAYARAQGESAAVAEAIREHYQPKGAAGVPAVTSAGALVALADRFDTLVGCFAVGLSPTGAADPYALRRACIGSLRTLFAQTMDLRLSEAFQAAYATFDGVDLDLDQTALVDKLGGFFRDRLRGLLTADHPADVVDAALAVAGDRPLDARARAASIAALDAETRAKVGEVFKRANNIAKDAPAGEPTAGDEAAEQALHEQFYAVKSELEQDAKQGHYARAFERVAALAPALATYFEEVFVMAEDEAVRNNRLRLMRAISETCSSLARLELLGQG